MNEEIELSRDYRAAWDRAKKLKNLSEMDRIFDELLTELGYPNAGKESRQEIAAKELAELLNDRDAGKGNKKL